MYNDIFLFIGKFDFKKTVVVDTGCGLLKAGLAGEIAPSEIIPSVIGVPRRFSQDVSKMTRGYYVGDAAITHAGMLQLGLFIFLLFHIPCFHIEAIYFVVVSLWFVVNCVLESNIFRFNFIYSKAL